MRESSSGCRCNRKPAHLPRLPPDREHTLSLPERTRLIPALEPVLVLTLPNSLDEGRNAEVTSFGPALNLGQKAEQAGVRHIVIDRRRAI